MTAARQLQPRREKGAEPPRGRGEAARAARDYGTEPAPGPGPAGEPLIHPSVPAGAPAPLGCEAGPERSPQPPGRGTLSPGRRRHKERLRRGGAHEGAALARAREKKHRQPLSCSRDSGPCLSAGPSPRDGPRPPRRPPPRLTARRPCPPTPTRALGPRSHLAPESPSRVTQPSLLPPAPAPTPGPALPHPPPRALTACHGPTTHRPAAHPPTPPRARQPLPRPRRLISEAGRRRAAANRRPAHRARPATADERAGGGLAVPSFSLAAAAGGRQPREGWCGSGSGSGDPRKAKLR